MKHPSHGQISSSSSRVGREHLTKAYIKADHRTTIHDETLSTLYKGSAWVLLYHGSEMLPQLNVGRPTGKPLRMSANVNTI